MPTRRTDGREPTTSAGATTGLRSSSLLSCGVGFETGGTMGEQGAEPVSKAEHDQARIGESIRGIGNRLGLQPRKPDDNHGNANGRALPAQLSGHLFGVKRALPPALCHMRMSLMGKEVRKEELANHLCARSTRCAAIAYQDYWAVPD
jgi:hypothetical protein